MVVIRALNIALPQKGALEFNFMLRIMENKKFNYSRDICFISRNLVKLHAVWFIRDTVKFGQEPSLKCFRIQSSIVPCFVP